MVHSRSALSQDLIPQQASFQVSIELSRPSFHVSSPSANGSWPPDPSTQMDPSSLKNSRRGDDEKRVVYINNPEKTNERYDFSGNKIKTSKYTLLSFLPRNLFEQFHRIAYIYFLVIAILNQLPQLAVFGRTVSLFPLLFVLIVTAIKDGYEDWRRHRSDRKENNRLALVLQEGEYTHKKWKDILVGEIVKVIANETIPCDMVLLSTSEESGVAYIQTINLDGESNLKTRYARQETASNHPHLVPPHGQVICEEPNRNVYGFTAYMEYDNKNLSLGPTNVILRGCQLKNTSWVVGVVVYAGKETKAMLNSSGAQLKRSRLEHSMNEGMWWLSVFLLIICFIGALGLGIWLRRHSNELNVLPYFGKKFLSGPEKGEDYNYYNFVGEVFFGFLSFVIIFQVMIPISLYISMDLVRAGQSFFMISDDEMYHISSDSRFQCRALNINEDLGQIKYVFSDKTGTLTENKMEFRIASIHGVSYSSENVVKELESRNEGNEGYEHATDGVLRKQAWKSKVEVKLDLALVKILQSTFDSWERKVVHDYLLTLAACNTVVPIKGKMTYTSEATGLAYPVDNTSGLIEYQGESPDEQALVAAAAAYGYTLLERGSNYILIDVLGEVQKFQVLGMHEFDSVRKCMATVLEYPDKTVKVLVKGADSTVLNKLSLGSGVKDTSQMDEDRHAQLIFATRLHLDLYSRQGLRTLVVAAKQLEVEELETWKHKYSKASTALVDRGVLLQDAAKVVEKDLLLLGATGIEDKLQDGVPEAIAALREAGIHVWVLTGDKQETAISIGYSCSLLTDDMRQIIINENDKQSCHEALVNAMISYKIKQEVTSRPLKLQNSFVTREEKFNDAVRLSKFFSSISESESNPVSLEPEMLEKVVRDSNMQQPLALIIDGNTLVHALEPDIEQELYDLAIACQVVICCRVAPLQKAGIVSLVKRKSRDMTLAIGDGANDVSMIQMADVGIGISGQEGRQAVMASDFAMGQFKFLKRLLLVHGYWNYRRLGHMVLYNFYRNAVFIMMLFWYIFHNAFSPLSAITDWSLVLYSLIYTSVPTTVVAILDKGISHETLLRYPNLYSAGQKDTSYNKKLFWLTMLDTLWQSLVLFYVPYLTFQESTIDIWGLGSIWTIAVVILVNLHLAMDIQYWTWITHVAVWGSIAATYMSLFILDSINSSGFLPHYWVVFHVIQMTSYWLDIFLIVCLALLPRFCAKAIINQRWPSDSQVAHEAEILVRNKRDATI